MRKGLTLIELILSMVIIGIVFTVIPRLIMSMNQSTQTTLKEEAMYNAMAQIGMVLNLPWDNNNTQNSQILSVNAGDAAYNCNTTSGYRIGGFIGGRNCITPPLESYAAGAIGQEGDGLSNDIDDFHNTNITADKNCTGVVLGLFRIGTTVTYVIDPASTGTIALSTADQSPNQTNTKRILIRVGYGPSSRQSGCITSLEYHAFNIGHIQINSRNWN
ncbi:prepilin-type N-terminal cleavage/methylation domain-containing protein [Sulfuricurvum sp.]|uniref:type II secretion system protein n=1 Tax=Sulfuricurvum sp. TaxID=2025608 RepID=UPI0026026C14|nr:prepilin-type N-terminal cleavage/methylation domain-containing protein [Sulfuricurvum sp.]MDD3598136.1 prepilin-type N-terminal cleavage/methylation domain-containing protein [Sulfuricurvum sp.]